MPQRGHDAAKALAEIFMSKQKLEFKEWSRIVTSIFNQQDSDAVCMVIKNKVMQSRQKKHERRSSIGGTNTAARSKSRLRGRISSAQHT